MKIKPYTTYGASDINYSSIKMLQSEVHFYNLNYNHNTLIVQAIGGNTSPRHVSRTKIHKQ
jgi:hypothetical protein